MTSLLVLAVRGVQSCLSSLLIPSDTQTDRQNETVDSNVFELRPTEAFDSARHSTMEDATTIDNSLELPHSLRVMSMNCWGLKFLAKFRHERLCEIGTQIAVANPPPAIVGLQECWTQQDYREIRKRTKHILPYGKFYYSGIFGGGLAILSKWPIEESSMMRYSLNGRPTAFFRGDWFVGKGVACARIRIGPARKDVVEVFCTHVGYSRNLQCAIADLVLFASSMPRTSENPTILTSAIELPRLGRLQS